MLTQKKMQKPDGAGRVAFTVRVQDDTRRRAKQLALDYDITPGQVIDTALAHTDAVGDWIREALQEGDDDDGQ